MKVLTEAAILRAKFYSDVFSNDQDVAKKQFRAYCKLYHPDANTSANAQKVFEKLSELYNSHTTKCADNTIMFSNKSGGGFSFTNPYVINCGCYTAYHTQTKISLLFKKEFKKFYDNYMRNLKNLEYVDDRMKENFSMLFPKVLKSFEDTEGNFVILIDKAKNVYNLGIILKSYQAKGEKFPDRHAAWILNRLYNIETYFHHYNKVFNGFSMNNLWVSPELHTVMVYGGWEYMTKMGDKMIGCPKDVYKVLPITARDNHLSTTTTDLESIRQIGRSLYNGYSGAVVDFLNDGADDITPLEEWDAFGGAIIKDYGTRKFVVWDNIPYDRD